ncbi:hypothetical protein NPIL_640011, partial [Nephila pilipes]
ASSLEKKPLGRSLTQPQGTEQYKYVTVESIFRCVFYDEG